MLLVRGRKVSHGRFPMKPGKSVVRFVTTRACETKALYFRHAVLAWRRFPSFRLKLLNIYYIWHFAETPTKW